MHDDLEMANVPRRFSPTSNDDQDDHTPSDIVLTHRIEAALKRVSSRALQYEYQMKVLEVKLTENLGNFRAVEGLVQERISHVQRNSRRAEKALHSHVPSMSRDLELSMTTLEELELTLPHVRSQAIDARRAYDSGRKKAQILVSDLTWLNTDFHIRWRRIIFNTEVPVSERHQTLMRTLFMITTSICLWLAWISLRGVYRAHRQRLVWGERLIS